MLQAGGALERVLLMNRISLMVSELRMKSQVNANEAAMRPVAVLALVAGVIAFGIISGLLVDQVSPVAALAGLALCLIALNRPEFIILLVLVMSSTVIDPSIVPTISIGFKFTAVELSLGLLLGIILVKYIVSPYKSTLVRTPLDLPILLFVGASTISFFYAVYSRGVDRGWLVPQWRIIFCYLVFFAVTNFIRTRRQFVMFTGVLLALGATTATLVVLQAVAGPSLRILPNVSLGVANVFDQEYADVSRVIVPGTPLIFMLLIPILILYSFPTLRRGIKGLIFPAVIILLLAAIAISFSRTWWMGIGVAMLGLFLFVSARQWGFLLGRIGIPVVVLLLAIPLVGSFVPQAGNVVQVLGLRAGSLFAGEQTIQDSSTQWRIREIDSAFVKIQEHPILGVGPGGELRDPWWNTDDLTRFMHNSYLFILADLGVLGFLPFLWFSAAFLFRGFHYGRKLEDPTLKGWVLGLTLSYVALAVASISGPEFMAWHTVPVIGVILGLNEVAIRLGQPATTGTSVHGS